MSVTRIERIKQYSREKGQNQPTDSFEADRNKFALNKYAHLEQWEKIARSTADAVRSQKIYIEPFDHIIGRTYHLNSLQPDAFDPDLDDITCAEKRVRAEIEDYAEFQKYQLTGGTSKGHIAWDWNLLLKCGTEGLKSTCRAEIDRKKDEKSRRF